MEKILIFLIAGLCSYPIYAQVPEDALRNAWYIPMGSARSMAIGGAVGALGGDISANNINPAGIGLYKTREIVFSPGFLMNHNKINFRGTENEKQDAGLSYGSSGIVIGGYNISNRLGNITSSSFSFSITQITSFNNHTYYSGFNNVSSFSEQYLEELAQSGANIQSAENDYIFGSSLAYRTFLIDTFNINGQLAGYKSMVPVASGIFQERTEDTRGGFHEASFAFARNNADQLYLGISVNIPFSVYNRDLTYTEKDASEDPDNNFDYFTFTQKYSSTGVGINAKLGLIYKVSPLFRWGLAIHTPSFISFHDQLRAAMTTNTENYAGIVSESSDHLNNGYPGEVNYLLQTPWRAIASGAFVISNNSDTKLQHGFISADLEYVNYKGSRFYTASDDAGQKTYYDQVNAVIKDYYQGALNFRIGGELKFDPWMFRLGAAYYGSPYADKMLKASRIQASGGIGYRQHGFFIDLTYAAFFNRDVNFPYRLTGIPNTFAEMKNTQGNLLLTLGIKI
ncbi:MAG: hypothetical protein JSS67_10445 [Bacteroidetes bacterium]|nr:hypothetical protein [Bacteroidota bacterium]